MTADPVALCAQGEAAWHAAAYAGLGARWDDDDVLARGYAVPHAMLLGAVTLAPDAEVPADVPGIVCDSFARLRLPGREAEPAGWWMIREPGRSAETAAVPGLVIHRAVTDADVAWFEQLSFLAADGHPPQRPGELHPPGSQRLPGVTLLFAELDGAGVGTAASIATARVNNIGAVAVLPAFRRRGIGSALTEAAVAVAPGVPATLAATPVGRGVYRRLGFRDVGRAVHHHPTERR
ncbi:MAG: GNAT family N-acetyltransferase [Micropruina sp.]|uniref:GNAT family N-acetyltransferase n=1 Tax=Micropruina sp. TaxID=2737536 RepID=UPI0039E669DD